MLLHPQFIAQNIPSPDWTLFQAVINAYGFLPKLIYYAYFQPNGRVQEWDAAIASAIASTSALELLQVVTAIPCVSGIVTSIGSSPSLAGLSLSSHPRSSANSTLNCGSVNHNSSFSRILPSTKRNPRSLDIDTSSKFAARQHLMCLWRNPKFLPEAEAQFVTPRSREIMRAIAQRVPLPSETRDLAVFYQRIGGTPVEPFVLSDLMRRLEKGTCKLKTLLGSTGDPPQEQQPILDKKSHL
ncbi:hypothetical protein DL93DRAFT_182412 [Clavulina sp. PMI_390]|nr:hypothetical protein DL93DRAFT_182412 [Clavulina sp. PMI_390]